MRDTVYFDNAATTFPKPPEVIAFTDKVMREFCGNPGRSSHVIASKASETVYGCRKSIADYFGGKDENTVFSLNATQAINTALKTVLHKGDHVLISDVEHNSVYRPVYALARKGLITFDIYRSYTDGERQTAELKSKVRKETALVAACHHSNIFNFVLPIASIGAFCRKRGLIFMTDASQSAGLLPIDMKADCVDILCAPGHKGLYGIPGCGFTVFGERFESEIPDTFIEGGSGVRSADPEMPDFLPDRLEAGTVALPAIAALGKGIEFVRGFPDGYLRKREAALYERMKSRLSRNGKIRIYGGGGGGILLFSVAGHGSEEVASALGKYGICVRAGLHCAPLAHKKLATPQSGAVRVSFGAFNTESETDYFCSCVEKEFGRHV